MNRNYIKTFVILASVCLLFVITAIFGLYIFSIFREKESDLETYQFSQFNPLTNKTTFGFARIGKRGFDSQSILKYRNSEGSLAMVSKIFDNKYQCHGSCYCNERRAVATARSGLVVLVSAISFFMAVNIATEYIRSSCEEKYSGICQSEMIGAEIVDCEEFEGEDESESEKTGKYDCFGHCIDKGGLYEIFLRLKENNPNFICKYYEIEAGIIMDPVSPDDVLTIKRRFLDTVLEPFCNEIGMFNCEMEQVSETWKGVWNPVTNNVKYPCCVGHSERDDKLEHIKCSPYFDSN